MDDRNPSSGFSGPLNPSGLQIPNPSLQNIPNMQAPLGIPTIVQGQATIPRMENSSEDPSIRSTTNAPPKLMSLGGQYPPAQINPINAQGQIQGLQNQLGFPSLIPRQSDSSSIQSSSSQWSHISDTPVQLNSQPATNLVNMQAQQVVSLNSSPSIVSSELSSIQTNYQGITGTIQGNNPILNPQIQSIPLGQPPSISGQGNPLLNSGMMMQGSSVNPNQMINLMQGQMSYGSHSSTSSQRPSLLNGQFQQLGAVPQMNNQLAAFQNQSGASSIDESVQMVVDTSLHKGHGNSHINPSNHQNFSSIMSHSGLNPPAMNISAMNAPVMNPPVMNPPGMNPPVMNPPGMNPPVMNPPGMNPPGMNPPAMNAPAMNAPAMNPPAMNISAMNAPVMNPPGMNPPAMNLSAMNAPAMNAPGMNPPAMNISAMNAPGMNPPAMNISAMNAPVMNPPGMNPPAMNAPAMNAPAMNPPAMNLPAMKAPAMNPTAMKAPATKPLSMNPPSMNLPAMNQPSINKPGFSMNRPVINESSAGPGMNLPKNNPSAIPPPDSFHAPKLINEIKCPQIHAVEILNQIQREFSQIGPGMKYISEREVISVQTDQAQFHRVKNRVQTLLQNKMSNMKWAWLSDDGNYKEYDRISCQQIQRAYQLNNRGTVDVRIGQYDYTVKFGDPHTQQLKGQNKVIPRTVRRLDGTDRTNQKGNERVWKWKHESGQWRPYTAEACRQLQNASQGGLDAVLLQGSNGNAYLIDLKAKTQYNEKTQYSREILPPTQQ